MNRYELLRYERGESVAHVAAKTGIAVGTLRRLEDPDLDAKPTAPVAKALAAYYGLTITELLGLEDAA